MKATLVGNKLKVDDMASPYNQLNSYLTAKVYFVDGDNTEGNNGNDQFYASADGKHLHSVKAFASQTTYETAGVNANEIARIDPVTGIVELVPTKIAKEKLNKVAHSDLIQGLTARVKVKATACEYDIPLTEGEYFDIKFLRPISLTNAKADFEDAETNGSVKAISMSFIDWRNHSFTNAAQTKGHNYWMYYGITSIAVNTADALTDLNGDAMTFDANGNYVSGGKKLSSITSQLQFEYIAPTVFDTRNQYANDGIQILKNGQYGSLKYSNNGVTVGQFHMAFPAEITYDWGTLKTYVTCTIGKTQANARRR